MRNIVRITVITPLILLIAACAAPNSEKRVDRVKEDLVSDRAKNRMAQSDPAKLLEVARAYNKAGQLDAALRTYYQYKANVTEVAPAVDLEIAGIFRARGNNRAADIIVEELLESHPNDNQVKITLLNKLIAEDRGESALNIARSVKANDPVALQSLSATALMVFGYVEEGHNRFQALPTEGRTPKSIEMSALATAIRGDFKGAVHQLQPIMNLSGTMKQARHALSLIYALSGQDKVAKQIMAQAMGEDYLRPRIALIEMLPKMDQKEQSRALFLNQIDPTTIKRLTELE